jgi:plastocyanin
VVHRQLARRLGLSAIAAAALAGLALAPVASASNRQIAISNYRWSDPEVHIDLGEHVTWNWIGPDTMHSVTGTSPNATQFDSDPQTDQPQHRIGDQYKITFDQPGIYQLHCKLHSTVKGEVIVSDTPGDPVSEPDPVPKSNVDRKAPRLGGLSLKKSTFSKRSGTALRYTLNENSTVDADYYRFDKKGRRKFAGWSQFTGHVGYNGDHFANPGKHFKPRSGSYIALVRATDDAANESRPKKIRFRIR